MSVIDHEATLLNLVYFHDTLPPFFLITCTLNTITKLLDRQFDTSQGLQNFPSPLCSECIWYSPNILHMVTTVLTPRVHKLDHLPYSVSAFRMCKV